MVKKNKPTPHVVGEWAICYYSINLSCLFPPQRPLILDIVRDLSDTCDIITILLY